MMPTTR